MTANEALEGTQSDEHDEPNGIATESDSDAAEDVSGVDSEDGTITYKRSDIEKLRRESKGYRDRAQTAETRADELARALFTARVAATGKVENPNEIAYTADILDDVEAINQAVDEAISGRPYIKARSFGPVGLGERSNSTGPQDFSELFR